MKMENVCRLHTFRALNVKNIYWNHWLADLIVSQTVPRKEIEAMENWKMCFVLPRNLRAPIIDKKQMNKIRKEVKESFT